MKASLYVTSLAPLAAVLTLLLYMTMGTRTVSPAEPQRKQPNLKKLPDRSLFAQ